MSALLEIEDLHAGYGTVEVLRGVSLSVAHGEVVTLLGRNGMGKTTTVRTLFGLLPATAGVIRIDGQPMTGSPPHRMARAGLGLVPEGRQVFPTLSVEENLRAAARPVTATGAPGRWDLAACYAFFPRLAERRESPGARLSGGEQQMLAIARALMTNPRLLVLDEATEGLAPLVRAEIWDRLGALKAEGEAILVIDKNLAALERLADAHVILERGETVWRGRAQDLAADPDVIDRHLHL
ncbi:MAG: ABC transporter ATP-binding protein [Pseudomonadota bacterium]